jgi:hypothetical protein
MRWIYTFATLISLAPAMARAQPQADISNGIVHARFYLPDTVTGYYRATRFDWAGVMPVLEYRGHQYCGHWNPVYTPTVNDAIMGPVESFWPLGYEKTPAGGTFVQIGVGVLLRPDTARYSSFRYYPIKDAGEWRITRRKSKIEFRQRIHDPSYGYTYTKTVTLPMGEPEMVIAHRLSNMGREPIETNVFDHNFFVIDGQDLGAGYAIRSLFHPDTSGSRWPPDLAAIAGDSVVILRRFHPGETVFSVISGYGSNPTDYDFVLDNPLTGASLHIRGDRPLVRLVYWAYRNTLCPEPYIHISVGPGQTFTWSLRYRFEPRNIGGADDQRQGRYPDSRR